MEDIQMKKILLILLLLLLAGCCPRVTKSHDYRDSVRIEYRDRYRDKVTRDTTYLRDSIYVRDGGDTVTIYRDRYHYVDRYMKDTVNVTDTVYVNVYNDVVEVIEKKYVPKFFWICAMIAVGAVGYVLIKLARKFKLIKL